MRCTHYPIRDHMDGHATHGRSVESDDRQRPTENVDARRA